MTVSTANNLLMCPECQADGNFGDVSEHPAWLPTVANQIHFIHLDTFGICPHYKKSLLLLFVLPIPSAACQVRIANLRDISPMGTKWSTAAGCSPVHSGEYQAFLYKRDMFHAIIELGLGREAVASSCIHFVDAFLHGICWHPWDLKNLPGRLSRAFRIYELWCETEKKTTSLKKNTRANLHFGKAGSFPFLGSKGADVTLDLMCLDFFLKLRLRDPKDGVKKLLSAMQQLTQGLPTFLGIMRSHVLWLLLGCCGLTWKEGLKLCDATVLARKRPRKNKKKHEAQISFLGPYSVRAKRLPWNGSASHAEPLCL